MTGYLASLAARELAARETGAGGAPGAVSDAAPGTMPGAVMPRRVGAYEPWAMAAPLDVETSAPRSPDAEPHSAEAHGEPDRGEGRTGGELVDRARGEPRRAVPDEPRPTPAAIDSGVRAAVPLPRDERALDAAPRVPRPADSSGGVRHAPMFEAPVAPPAHSSGSPPRAMPAPAFAPAPAAIVPAPAVVAPAAPRAPVPVVVTARRAEARAEAPAATRGAVPNEPPPVVVTIGRIEVRAVPAPAAAPGARGARGARTAMSLEEYLRDRSRGLR